MLPDRTETFRIDVLGRILVQAALDVALYAGLAAIGLPFHPAQLLAFLAAVLAAQIRPDDLRRPLRPAAVILLIAALRGLLLVSLTDSLGVSLIAAVAVAAILSANGTSVGRSMMFSGQPRPDDEARWRGIAVVVVGYALLLRLAVSFGMDLLPEETYYWNYGEHLSLSYLDHPPLIGWSIRLFTEVLGQNQIGVRAVALISWFVAGSFVYRLTADLADRASGYRALVLFSTLPIYFSIGVIATPDAPLYACWAGALYFLARALLAERRAAWIGASISVGLGMLSKYTIGLLVPAALLFILLDRRSRSLLLGPWPWLASLGAAALFLPVVIWNAENGWASFTFQGARRWSAEGSFSLHALLGAILVLITPIGFCAAVVALTTRSREFRAASEDRPDARRKRRFVLIFTLLPLFVFVVFALDHSPKLNWAGPMWIAVLPFMARQMAGGTRGTHERLRAVWPATVAGSLVLIGLATYWFSIGAPGMPPLKKLRIPVAWEELGREMDLVARRIAGETGEQPIRVGVDPYFLSSEMSFYSDPAGRGRISGRHLIGGGSLMWEVWAPAEAAVGRSVLLVGEDRRSVDKPYWAKRFATLSEIHETPIVKRGRTVTRVYWRVGRGYRGPDAGAGSAANEAPR